MEGTVTTMQGTERSLSSIREVFNDLEHTCRELFWTVDITSSAVLLEAAEMLAQRVSQLDVRLSAAPPLFL
jgi:hypothetical protein